ncbi:hypothetical protein JCM11641_006289 [Rhodosporidiobolus odoratus]
MKHLLLPFAFALVLAAPNQHPFLSQLGPSTQQQPGSSSPITYPYRPLPWGDINILSTTDTHGWLLGHQRNEPSFSGDWGDLYSFVHRLKEQARERGVDLLLVDSGDRVDGNGLVDAEPSSHPKGYTALSIFSELPYDVVTTGNHELYKDPVAAYVASVMGDKFGDKWVVSNVNLTSTDVSTGKKQERPMGHRYRKFRTEMGRKVTAFGPLFDFKAHGSTVRVQKPSEMIKEQWFLDAILDKPDFFLLAGHMSLRLEPDSEWSIIVRTIREVHPTTPVLVFGGHHHIRDCVQEDPYSMSLAAGRYMETIGFMSVSGLNSSETPVFKRRYLDQNRNTYAYHTQPDFDTSKGRNITRWLSETAERFNLTEKFGVSPQDYFTARYPPSSPHSIFHLLTQEILPKVIRRDDRKTPYTVLNTGSVRFDLFKGDFTKNDQWIILPFTNSFLSIPSVPLSLAHKLLPYLNVVGEHGLLPSQSPHSAEYISSLSSFASGDAVVAAEAAMLEHEHREGQYEAWEAALIRAGKNGEIAMLKAEEQREAGGKGRWRTTPMTEGYVTLDACGPSSNDDPAERWGDDTAHRPFRTARQPVFVSTALPPLLSPQTADAEDEETVDVVFFDFIQPDIVWALNTLSVRERRGERWNAGDVEKYVEWVSANSLFEVYAKREWN